MAIRTQQIRDLIQLYAMSTGQADEGDARHGPPARSGPDGWVALPVARYSTALRFLVWAGFRARQHRGGMASGGGLVIQLDGPATTSLLRGEAVKAIANNPRAVATASMSAVKSNAGRRELTSLQLSPGLLTV